MFSDYRVKEGWATIFLLLLILSCVALSIQYAEWTEGLSILQGIVLLGGGLGIVLAKSRTPNRLAHTLSIIAGLAWAAYLTSRVLAGQTDISTSAAIVQLDWRVQNWLFVLFSEGTSGDNVIFLFLLSLLLWTIAYFSAWAIFRWQRAWWAVIVSGIGIMVNAIYAPVSSTGHLIAFLLFSLLLVVRTSIAFYEQEWRVARVAYSSDLVLSFLRAGMAISLIAILLAWATPKAVASRPLEQVWDKLSEPWRRIQNQSSRVFHDLNYRNDPNYIYSDRLMRFGGPVNLPDTPVFDAVALKGRYWRVMVFQEYTSTGWKNTDTDTLIIEANRELLAVPEFDLRREFTQTITLHHDLGPEGMIAAAGQPIRAGLPLRAVVSLVSPEQDMIEGRKVSTLFAAPGDPSVLYSRQPLAAGESYQVYASITEADAESLRQAGTDYPGWVTPRYLQLPDTVPARVRALAEEVTEGQETPYDKALAIERYLRQIPYNTQITGPGLTQDGVDYFLFDIREGYCDYYASAMAVMLRSVGVPARYVRGYGQGEKAEGAYRILKSDGHAWPEVFFPGYGWIEFEPTAGEPVLARPRSQNNELATENMNQDRETEMERQLDEEIDTEINPDVLPAVETPEQKPLWQRIGRWGWLALDLMLLPFAAIALFRARRQRQIEGLSVAQRVYLDLVEWVRRLLKIEQREHQTPHEYASVVGQTMPGGSRAVSKIADLYVEERFGAREISRAEAEVAWSQSWRAIWQRWIEQRVHGVRRIWWRLIPPRHQAEE